MKNILFLLPFLFISASLSAKTINNIDIAESVSYSDQSTKLVLNGAGVRTKFIFDIYVGSLYLEKKTSSAQAIYTLHGEKRVSMHILYDELSKDKLIDGWNTGFKNNLTSDELTKFKAQISQFNGLFDTVKKGDVINIHFIPTTGTHVKINNKLKGIVAGDDFFVALLKIWLGESPADTALKQGMLGENK